MSSSINPHCAVDGTIQHSFMVAQFTCFAVRVVICCCTKFRMLESRCDKLSTPAQRQSPIARILGRIFMGPADAATLAAT